jgi:hypothetical protein
VISRFLFGVFTAALALTANAAPPLPQDAPDIHLGVASCASSVCHGKIAPVKDSNVQLNEYRLWSVEDHHARAYKVLGEPASVNIARNLGLANAQTAKICLDCHLDNVPHNQRGAKFQDSDGIGCEGCHGGAQRWIETHTEPNSTHKANVAKGMYPTEDPYARAALCLSCHVGTAAKFANHRIMAAGHPRLSFELDTFTVNQPAHYTVDADYVRRKGAITPGYLWLVGQVQSARQLSGLIDHHVGAGVGSEFAVYDCHSCHHPMRPLRGQPQDFSAVLPVGSLRLLDYPYDMVAAMFAVLQPGQLNAWGEAVRTLHRSSVKPAQIKSATAELNRQLQGLAQLLRSNPPGIERLKELRRYIAAQGAAGRYADFTSAEQAFLALESLSYAINDRPNWVKALDEIYKSVADEHTFQAGRFAQASRALAQ